MRAHRSAEALDRADELAWHLAGVAVARPPLDDAAVAMVLNRVIDDVAVATAALTRSPVAAARDQARARPATPGATVLGLDPRERVAPEWAAWANAVAVRELDFHDTFLAAEYAHPGDAIAPLVALAQHRALRDRLTGEDLVRAILTAYEVQIDLCRAISLHAHQIDHVAHLGPAVAAGAGTLLCLDREVVYQAIGQALHTTTQTRQSRKGAISTWKAYAPAFAGKVALEAVDRAQRGQSAPAPIYEGEDGVLARLLGGFDVTYHVPLPEPDEPRRAILDSFTKAHSAEYQAQAWIDLAMRLHATEPALADPDQVAEIVIETSHHTHAVIGSGAGDPQKYDPQASRETLDHSLPYILAVALQDGSWHHERSYARERATRPDTVALWRTVTTREDPEWSRRYLSTDPAQRAFGGRLRARLRDGHEVVAEIAVPDAHPLGAHPFARADYVAKLATLAAGVVADEETARIVALVEGLPGAGPAQLAGLTVRARPGLVDAVTTEGVL